MHNESRMDEQTKARGYARSRTFHHGEEGKMLWSPGSRSLEQCSSKSDEWLASKKCGSRKKADEMSGRKESDKTRAVETPAQGQTSQDEVVELWVAEGLKVDRIWLTFWERFCSPREGEEVAVPDDTAADRADGKRPGFGDWRCCCFCCWMEVARPSDCWKCDPAPIWLASELGHLSGTEEAIEAVAEGSRSCFCRFEWSSSAILKWVVSDSLATFNLPPATMLTLMTLDGWSLDGEPLICKTDDGGVRVDRASGLAVDLPVSLREWGAALLHDIRGGYAGPWLVWACCGFFWTALSASLSWRIWMAVELR